jgi:hypothetical protein
VAESVSKQELAERAEAGDPDAMCQLAYLLGQEGDNRGAEYWYREAAERGIPIAMVNLGSRVGFRGDLDEAEELFRRAIDAGHDEALVNLGLARQDRGDLTGAEAIFSAALDRGVPGAAEQLASLELKCQTDPFLRSISFETFGWSLCQNRTGQMRWQEGNAFVDERYSDQPPFFTSLDERAVRADLMQALDLLDSEDFDMNDLLDEGARYGMRAPTVLPAQTLLLECRVYPGDEAPRVEVVVRTRTNGDVHFTSNIFVLFASSFWLLQLDIREEDPIGEREGAVARVVLEAGPDTAGSHVDFDPYHTRWDGLVPVESDPLTRLRSLAAQIRDSTSIGEQALGLERFDPG